MPSSYPLVFTRSSKLSLSLRMRGLACSRRMLKAGTHFFRLFELIIGFLLFLPFDIL